VLAAACLFTPLLLDAATLFPKPLHIVRKVDDSLSAVSATIDEYCAGNRIVSVRGSVITIVDYDKQELTEIDHTAGTYSITKFDDIARARGKFDAATGVKAVASSAAPKWRTTPLGARPSAAGRSLETTEMVRESSGSKEQINIGIDRQVSLSREAVEALIGASYPNAHTERHDLLLGAAGPQSGGSGRANATSVAPNDAYGLPSEQTITFELDGSRVVAHNAVLSVTFDTVPPEALNIDPNAKRVESKGTAIVKELQQLDQLPAPSRP
jgi:hypothetical protein